MGRLSDSNSSGGRLKSSAQGELKTSGGLYNLALNNGLKNQADSILKNQQGEKTKEIFSGGFITDVFDVLNAFQYGTVGLLKGKSFSDGVKTRQSFTDKDALGDKGLPGVITGTLLDIAFDPLTYIAPTTIVKKIPFASKFLKGTKELVFGKKVSKAIEGTAKTFEAVEGGTRAGRMLASKLVYMQGADPAFREVFERSVKNIAVETQITTDLGKSISQLAPETALKLLKRDETGRITRASVDELKSVLSPEEMKPVTELFNKIQTLGKEAVDIGLVSKNTFEANFDTYIKNAYLEYETAKGKGLFGFSKIGIKGVKSRKAVENVSEFGLTQIDNPAYLLFKTVVDLTKDVENAKLFKQVASKFGTDVAQEGFTLIPKTSKFTSSAGKQSEILSGVKKINTDLKPLFKELKMTFKADRKVLAEIVGMERRIGSLGKLQSEELYKFFNEGIDITKTVTKARKLGIINESLQPLANTLKKFKNLEEFKNLPEGIQLEKAFINGDLQRGGFKSMQDFLDTVKNPFKAAETKTITKIADEIPGFKVVGDNITEITKAGKQVTRKMDDIEKRLYETKVVKESLPLKSRIMEGVKPHPTKVFTDELKLLKDKIGNFNKGYKFASKEIKNIQSYAINIVKKNFSVEKRGQFLSDIKNATTKEKSEALITKLKDKFDDLIIKNQDEIASKQMSKVVGFQKEIEKLVGKSKTLSEIDKRSINDSFRFLEKNINDLRFGKEDLLENLADAKLGDLAGKYIPSNMAEYLQDIISPAKDSFAKALVGNFKFFKVVMNPATHARNIISNKMLNYWKLGMNPLDPKVIKAEATAIGEITKGFGKWSDEARSFGYNVDTFASAEMKGLLDSAEMSGAFTKVGKLWHTAKKKLGDIYQGEENMAKLSSYIFQRGKGISPEEAWKSAESATFNYAQVTPFIKKLRESLFGLPFITFTVKATPVALETIAKNPGRVSVIGKIKQSIENLSDIEETDRERASEPSWVKEGFFIKLPIKDKQGRSAYFDLTYILPFGDLISGNFLERGQSLEKGVPENRVVSFSNKSPFIQTVTSIGKNKDFYGNSIWRDSDSETRQLKDLMTFLTKSYVPPLIADQLPGGYNRKGERQQRGIVGALTPQEKENQQRTLMQELLRNVGAKVQPIDADIQETYQEWNKKKGLETLLRERGVLNTLNLNYVPKD